MSANAGVRILVSPQLEGDLKNGSYWEKGALRKVKADGFTISLGDLTHMIETKCGIVWKGAIGQHSDAMDIQEFLEIPWVMRT